LADIQSSAHRLRRLASDLATTSRLHGATLELRLEDVSLTRALRRAAARRETAEAGVQIDVDVPHEAVMRADAERLAQALDNLLDNAVRHGAPPFALLGDAVGDAIHIRVTDAGSGVPAEIVPRLFQRFSIAGASGGTGLGLYLIREIARGHGGEAEYHPPGPGQPTTFEIRLPRNHS
jgi:signal transduction histidine kinase